MDRSPDVIVISGETNVSRLLEVVNAGVTRFIPKPASLEQIRNAVNEVIEERETRALAFKRRVAEKSGGVSLIGDSSAMQRLREEIDTAVRGGIKDILVVGESGTGKELVARTIAGLADNSGRFIAINCSAFTQELVQSELFGHVRGAFTGADRDKVGIFEAASGGFVFMDEVGEMALPVQARLLRVIQERTVMRVGSVDEKKVNFRTVSATNVDLHKAMTDGKFRSDLYYRLAKIVIRVPPLRERLDDIPKLVHFFLEAAEGGQKVSITPESIRLLQAYNWPGNVRQLQGVLEVARARALGRGGVIREKEICEVLPEVSDIPSSRLTKKLVGAYGVSLMLTEKKRYERAIIAAKGDRTKAAEALGVSRATFFRRAKELGLVKTRILASDGPDYFN